MSDSDLYKRMNLSAKDFVIGVQPILEKKLDAEIYPIELLNSENKELARHNSSGKLIKKLDQVGIDAFYYCQDGTISGLASRMRYTRFSADNPEFSFRYSLWDSRRNMWNDEREFKRKLDAAYSADRFNLFPKLHVESFSSKKGEGLITWSYAAKTKDVLDFIYHNFDSNKVNLIEPKNGEKRRFVSVPVKYLEQECEVLSLGKDLHQQSHALRSKK